MRAHVGFVALIVTLGCAGCVEQPRYVPLRGPGPMVTEIGWRQPLILSRYEGDWDILDTSTGNHTKISAEQRSNDPAYRNIPVYPARTAWARLKRYKSLW
jgi:hypothetical protein